MTLKYWRDTLDVVSMISLNKTVRKCSTSSNDGDPVFRELSTESL